MTAHDGRLSTWLRLGECESIGPGGRDWVRQRPVFVAVVTAVNLALFALAGLSPVRLAVTAALAAIPLTVAVLGAVLTRKHELSPTSLWRWLAIGAVFIPCILAATGGVHSPLIPVLVAPVLAIVAIWRWTRPARALVAAFVTSVIVLFALPRAVTGAPLPSPWFEIMISLNLILSVSFGCRSMLGLSEGLASTSRVLESVRAGALEAATRRVRSLEQVGAKVAHELKNPLAAIKSLMQLELGTARDERSQRRLEVMTREVARMEGILRDYLSFSRPLEDLRLGDVDLGAVADNVVALLEGRAQDAGVQLARTGAGARIAGDGRRLEEAVLNLAANALEATPRGGRVALEVEPLGPGGVLRVRDTGAGMSAAVLEKIGTPFFTTRSEGTGLGVVLARAVIGQHGGRLDFASRPGEGTTATVHLPPAPPARELGAKGGGDGPSAAG